MKSTHILQRRDDGRRQGSADEVNFSQLYHQVQCVTKLMTRFSTALDRGNQEINIDEFQNKMDTLSTTLMSMSKPKLYRDPILKNLMDDLTKAILLFHEGINQNQLRDSHLVSQASAVKKHNDVLNTYLRIS